MSSIGERAATDPRVALGLGAIVLALSVFAVVTDAFLNNEGIFTYLFAGMVGDDPIATLFFLKSRPPVAAFYAPAAAIGFDAFAILHALVTAAAVPLTAAVARAAGQRWPNLPAALVAASALLVPCAASGVSNADGMTLGVLAVALLAAWKRPAAAGAVAALIPLARAEMALLAVALVVHVLVSRDRLVIRRFFVGLAAIAVAYAALGALYHQDAIWFLHHPPHVTHSVPYSEIMGRQMFGGAPHQITLNYLLLTPAVGLILFLRPSRLAPIERTIAIFLVVFVSILSILPGVAPLNFGDMPRYVLPALPFLALVAARAVEALAGDPEPLSRWGLRIGALGALLVAAHVQDAARDAPALLYAVLGWSLVAVVAATPWRRAVPALTVALCVAAAPWLVGGSRLALDPDVAALGRHLVAHADPATSVLTNVSELPLWLTRHGGEDVDVHHLMAADQRYELETLANDAVGQDDALRTLLRDHWYGPVVFEEDIPARLRPGTWLALREDARTTHLIDLEAIEAASYAIEVGDRARVVRLEDR